MGDPGTWLIDCGTVEIGKRLNLPTHTYMGSTDAKTLDAQSGLESAGGTILAALAGVNMVSGAGMIDYLRCQSFEKLVIDAEIIDMAKRLVQGIQPRDLPMAQDILSQVGHTGSFLSAPHTQRWFRRELHFPSPIIDRGSLDAWQKSGAKTILDRAADRVEHLVAEAPPSPLTGELHRELRAITLKAAQNVGMDSLPDLPT
jgi:trimethylamine--corrinoid protein Co-methyltransferase